MVWLSLCWISDVIDSPTAADDGAVSVELMWWKSDINILKCEKQEVQQVCTAVLDQLGPTIK